MSPTLHLSYFALQSFAFVFAFFWVIKESRKKKYKDYKERQKTGKEKNNFSNTCHSFVLGVGSLSFFCPGCRLLLEALKLFFFSKSFYSQTKLMRNITFFDLKIKVWLRAKCSLFSRQEIVLSFFLTIRHRCANPPLT